MLIDPDWPYLGDDWCEYQHLDKASEHSYCKLFLQETCDYKIHFFSYWLSWRTLRSFDLFVIALNVNLLNLFFISETCVFAYLGMAIFSFKHQFRPAFVIWTIVSIVKGRLFPRKNVQKFLPDCFTNSFLRIWLLRLFYVNP